MGGGEGKEVRCYRPPTHAHARVFLMRNAVKKVDKVDRANLNDEQGNVLFWFQQGIERVGLATRAVNTGGTVCRSAEI